MHWLYWSLHPENTTHGLGCFGRMTAHLEMGSAEVEKAAAPTEG